MKKIIVMIVLLLNGCSMNSVVMHDGGNLARKDTAVVSVFGNYGEKKVSLRLTEVDGQPVPGSSNFMTYEVQLKPGKHKLKYYVWHDLHAASWKEAYVETEYTLQIGHTYFPDVEIKDGKQANVWMVDKGENYPVECNHGLLASNKYPKEKCK